jgi:hypothetical protein
MEQNTPLDLSSNTDAPGPTFRKVLSASIVVLVGTTYKTAFPVITNSVPKLKKKRLGFSKVPLPKKGYPTTEKKSSNAEKTYCPVNGKKCD